MRKLLQLLLLLSGNRRYSLTELMEKFKQSDRTIYRHLEAIKQAGFVLQLHQGRYQLQTHNDAARSLQKLMHFSEEEACLLYRTMQLLQGSSPIKDRLASKLNALYDVKAMAMLENTSSHQMIHELAQAIAQGKQVKLKAYRSGNSLQIADRIVEPFDFLTDYSGVWCYDTASRSNKHFKIARIAAVEILPNSVRYPHLHSKPFTDAFRMSATAPIATVTATLSLKAYNLLIEEFPLAETGIKQVNGQYLLAVPIADYKGIGRFALGLAGEVQVHTPKAFVKFLKDRAKLIVGK